MVNLEPFLTRYPITARASACRDGAPPATGVPELDALLGAIGGCTFDHGIYRILRSEDSPSVALAMGRVLLGLSGRVMPFGVDWLGRYFVLDLRQASKPDPVILMIEVGAGEAVEIPASLEDFHNRELVEFADASLAVSFWSQWRASNPSDLPFESCVGYKVPLFLGGMDDVSNLEVIDLQTYVDLCGQLRNRTRVLPVGTTIRQIALGNDGAK